MLQFLLTLPNLARSAPFRVGDFRYSAEFEKHIYLGKPIDVDPFNPASVAEFNSTVRRQMAFGLQLALKQGKALLVPAVELVPLPDEPDAIPPETVAQAIEPDPVPAPARVAKKKPQAAVEAVT